jgi:alkylation response protein AidB-like acyl-CoA dehydrogenase
MGGAAVDLEFRDEEAELRDNVREVLAGICPPSVVRHLYDAHEYPTAVWDKMVELYWPALAIHTDHGGLGLGFLEVGVVAEELGRANVPSPLLATISQFVPLIQEAGDQAAHERFLPGVAAGEIRGTVALAEGGQWTLNAVQTRAELSGGMWRLQGDKSFVFDGDRTDEIAVVARGDAGFGVFVVPAAAIVAKAAPTLDPTIPLAHVQLADVEVSADRVIAAPGTPGVERAIARATQEATVALALSTVGTCRVIFEQTLEYAKVREQYGKPIGSFQALKHRFADMYLAVERATSLSYFAALTIAEDDSRRAEAASLAKAAAGECQRLVVGEGLQLHGGIGFTWENDLHFWLKRAKNGDALYGDAAAHRAVLAELLGLTKATVAA